MWTCPIGEKCPQIDENCPNQPTKKNTKKSSDAYILRKNHHQLHTYVVFFFLHERAGSLKIIITPPIKNTLYLCNTFLFLRNESIKKRNRTNKRKTCFPITEQGCSCFPIFKSYFLHKLKKAENFILEFLNF